MTVHCAKCGHQWTLPMKLPMLLDRAVKAMKGFAAAGCPECGAYGNDVLCGPALGEKTTLTVDFDGVRLRQDAEDIREER